MKITILTPNFSSNCLGRAYILAKMLSCRWQVEIVGPMFGESIWSPVADEKDIEFKPCKLKSHDHYLFNLRKIMKKIDGDVIYVSKPLMTSFLPGLLCKFFKKKPLILDIDDWDLGFVKESYKKLSGFCRFKHFVHSFLDYACYWNILFMEKLVNLADVKTVSNSFLKEKFSGRLIYHARDAQIFDPQRYDAKALKVRYGLSSKKIVSFIGTARKHKGLDTLIEAVSLIEDQDLVLMFVGLEGRENPYGLMAKEKLGLSRVMIFGKQLFSKIREYLAISDVIVVPQEDNFSTKGQFPAKIFDAMAMAKPVVSTDVNDIPKVLDGCGLIVPSKDAEKMAEAIKSLIDNEKYSADMGKRARERFLEKYSYEKVGKALFEVFSKYEK